ncbi:MAG TPA: glucosaminidase domain-containing protein [Ktedonobacteraceae bacterium]|nr:glucosaminidase domain-containing protein [Ktedonobacteraceae bacterium]
MASGNYTTRKNITTEPAQLLIPARATRQLPAISANTNAPEPYTAKPLAVTRPKQVIDEFAPHPLAQHAFWLRPFLICMVVIVASAITLTYTGISQRPGPSHVIIATNAQVFPIQVGGTLGAVNAWAKSNGPTTPVVPIPKHLGPYSVVGPNSLSVAFMNSILAYYHSPAAGKAQALWDDGKKYGLDSAYALAFFMHESSFGTTGVARVTLSLSNMRCVPEYRCLNENGGYAIFDTWEQSFEAWFKLIRDLYVGYWGRITVDQIIPKYAPNSDGNNEAGYIANLKHTIDTWRAGVIQA